MLLGYFFVKIPPQSFWPAPFFSLLFPFFFIMNFLLIIFWIFKKRWYWVPALIGAIIAFGGITKIISVGRLMPQQDYPNKDTLRIANWNVRLFDLYNWSNNVKTKEKMFDVLQEMSADIYCFQEFYFQPKTTKEFYFNTKDALTKKLNISYVCDYYTDRVLKQHYFGAAIFSKYPIVGKGKILFNDAPGNICIYADVLLPNSDTIRIYNLHLASIRFSKEETDFIASAGNQKKDYVSWDDIGLSIVNRMKKAYLKRGNQLSLVLDNIKSCPYPYIICGDFNDPPNSYTYHMLKQNLHDAFLEKGLFLGHTYNDLLPLLRIDYILYPDYFAIYSFKRYQNKYSDHIPLVADLMFDKKKKIK